MEEQGREERKRERETGERRREDGRASLRTVPQEAGRGHGLSTHVYMMLCRMEAKGVMPTPAPMSTARSEVKILWEGVP